MADHVWLKALDGSSSCEQCGVKWIDNHDDPRPCPYSGTPLARLTYLLEELERRFPGVVNPVSSEPPEPLLLKAIDNLLAKHAAPPRCRVRWRAGILVPPGTVPIPDGARCTLPPHGDDIDHQFGRP